MSRAPDSLSEPASNAGEYSVSEISGALKRTVEDAFGHVRVRGEISGYRGPHSSGHAYFALKDERARLEAVIWRTSFSKLAFKPEEGLEVVATGKLTTYPGSSKYQIVIEDLKPAGTGALMALLNERRLKLEAEGLFDPARKRRLPYLPRVVGVVTSPTGAVIRDIRHRIADRFPVHVIVWPVRVQGETSGAEVAAAIEGFNAIEPGGPIPRPDVLIVARGGGSLEDLWGFNDEAVVRAAAGSAIPLVSAVGHETDWTLIDHAADLRAPTPTGAAEMVVPVRADLLAALSAVHARHGGAMSRGIHHARRAADGLARALPSPDTLLALPRRRLDEATSALDRNLRAIQGERAARLDRAGSGLQLSRLDALVADRRARLERGALKAGHALGAMVARRRSAFLRASAALQPQGLAGRSREARRHLAYLEARLILAAERAATARRERLVAAWRMAESLDPERVLERGYAIVRDEAGAPVTRAEGFLPGALYEIEFAGRERRAATAVLDGSRPAPPPAQPTRPRRARVATPASQTDLFGDSS
ncbi:exodeoxyribonuclease VII large subunit [Aureimonas mangrovi]|uniref:exodeoxyribonuclease VII large subunit n=1 Tax=Aureimonas mangrovi TaxID=2758041 RepID=UPI00163DE0A6|nr:exodeoxyribonuclease VII large subunit [Aureimonas mangrovi]